MFINASLGMTFRKRPAMMADENKSKTIFDALDRIMV